MNNKTLVAAHSTGAVFDLSGRYRYLLWRLWRSEEPAVTFVMLNPSTADARADDPTIRRCAGLARSWGYGGITVVNLFGFRAAKPAGLLGATDPVGRHNDGFIAAAVDGAALVIAGWGNHGAVPAASDRVARLLQSSTVHCLGRTRLGQPRHPLYVKGDVMPQPFDLAVYPSACTRFGMPESRGP